MRILVAEDDSDISNSVASALRESDFIVDIVERGDDALKAATEVTYDALVLDVLMPGMDGLSVMRSLREQRITTPVIILTARGEVSEKVEGLMLGADDYMAKPFSPKELVARVVALTRRSGSQGLTQLKVGDLVMNMISREVFRAGVKLDLPVREFALLEFFMRNPGKVLTRTQLIENVWRWHFESGTNVVEVYILRLRRKVDDGHEVKLINTVRSVGYVISAPAA